jgi:hypothetical protein
MSGLCFASMVGGLLVGGTASFGGHGHASHGSTHPAASHAPKAASHAPKAQHEAPKHSGGKPAHHAAPKPEAKPKEHPHNHESGKPSAPQPQAGKSKEANHQEHKPIGMASESKTHEKSHEHHHDHHDDHHDELHHHRHGHEWVGGVDVENGSNSSSGSDGAAGLVVPGTDGTAAAAVVPALAGAALSNRPQIQFSVDPVERDSYDSAARAAGMSRGEWIRSRLNAAAARESK